MAICQPSVAPSQEGERRAKSELPGLGLLQSVGSFHFNNLHSIFPRSRFHLKKPLLLLTHQKATPPSLRFSYETTAMKSHLQALLLILFLTLGGLGQEWLEARSQILNQRLKPGFTFLPVDTAEKASLKSSPPPLPSCLNQSLSKSPNSCRSSSSED